MTMCRLMVSDYFGEFDWDDFRKHYKETEKPYDEGNLQFGIDYSKGLKEDYGFEVEPFLDYNIDDFIQWCQFKLTEIWIGSKTGGLK